MGDRRRDRGQSKDKQIKAIANIRGFFNEIQVELKKCAWPTKPELYESTVVVIISMLLFGFFVGASDTLLMWLMTLVIR